MSSIGPTGWKKYDYETVEKTDDGTATVDHAASANANLTTAVKYGFKGVGEVVAATVDFMFGKEYPGEPKRTVLDRLVAPVMGTVLVGIGIGTGVKDLSDAAVHGVAALFHRKR